MGKIVRKTLTDIKVTPAMKRHLKELASRPDGEIDLSDIPELTEDSFRNAIRNPWYRPVKKQLTVRLDADIIAWLKKKGSGYQTRMNALLRAAMLVETEQKRRRAS
ncbi:BrnA antitoxin family protein [Paracidobacterium acidisoli]|uniref:Cytoplasmic protein n=1 Tax=Paracidobacterium acidisoli TaxID=2303751 RepID=A0A372IRX9_9BACT|nr:BrnA antitoxin family protein [Paracidobacterium acidisoli]MBT9330585.1 BrnA antitoxin family protein [Paracidobacterium acidisoli]